MKTTSVICALLLLGACKSNSTQNSVAKEADQVEMQVLPWQQISELSLQDEGGTDFTLSSIKDQVTILNLVTEASKEISKATSNEIGLKLQALAPSESTSDLQRTKLTHFLVVVDISKMNFVKKKIANQLATKDYTMGLQNGFDYLRKHNLKVNLDDIARRTRLMIDLTGELGDILFGELDREEGLFAIINGDGNLLELSPGKFALSPQEINISEFVKIAELERNRIYSTNSN